MTPSDNSIQKMGFSVFFPDIYLLSPLSVSGIGYGPDLNMCGNEMMNSALVLF